MTFIIEDILNWTRAILGTLLIVGGLIALAVIFPPILVLYAIGFGFWLLGK